MNFEIKQTILVEEHKDTQSHARKNKMKCALYCFNICRPTFRRPVKQFKRKRHLSRVRFREPSKIEPINDRQPSWESYRSWSSPELDEALEEFIYQTLTTVREGLYEDVNNYTENPIDKEIQILDRAYEDRFVAK